MRWRWFAMLLVALMSSAGCVQAQSARAAAPWSYNGATGPDHWAELDPDYRVCAAGRQQSPVAIGQTKTADLPVLRFEYQSAPLKYLVNTGNTIRVNYHEPSEDFLLVGGERYQLFQFHFHRPSEETLHGQRFDMVAHLMHQSADGKVVGVAVMLKLGKANATVAQLWEHMPQTPGPEQAIAGVSVNPAGLLPAGLGYYTYMGALTAPPCTEDVQWFVLKTPVTISAAQLKAFAKLYPHNIREVQPLNGRIVSESP